MGIIKVHQILKRPISCLIQNLNTHPTSKQEESSKKAKLAGMQKSSDLLDLLQKAFAESREMGRKEAQECHGNRMEKLDRMNNIF